MDVLQEVFKDRSYRKFFRIAKETEIPGFVKEASLEIDADQLGPDAFGDPAKRTYPLNNRSNTWVSREYFERERCQYPPPLATVIGRRIEKAASFWKLEPSRTTKASPQEYHTVRAEHAGKPAFTLSIGSPTQWKEAAERLYSSRSQMTYDMRRSMARDLLAAPDRFRCALEGDLQEYLEKAAGLGCSTDGRVMQAVLARVVHVHRTHPDLSGKLVKAAEDIKGMAGDPGMLHKLARALDMVDRAVELHRYYGHGHPTPEESVFAVTEKLASQFCKEAVRLSTGDVVSASELLAKKAQVGEFFRNYFGEVPYKSDAELTQVVSSLPRDGASALLSTVPMTIMGR